MNIYYLTPIEEKIKDLTFDSLKSLFNQFRNKLRKREIFRGDTMIIYKHCDILKKNGYNACPIYIGNEKHKEPNWFFHQSRLTKFQYEDINKLSDEDIVICPDSSPELICNFNKGKKFLFVQNWAKYKNSSAENYGFDGILTFTGYCADYLKRLTKLPVYEIKNGIELNHFNYSVNLKKEDEVLILYRKNTDLIDKFFESLPRELRDYYNFKVVHEKVDKAKLIALYKESDIFLNFGYPEGFGLMPLEAMACGCVVCGFTGGGAKTHMIKDETALVVEDGNLEGMYNILLELRKNQILKSHIRKNGLLKAKEFSLGNMENSLLRVIEEIK